MFSTAMWKLPRSNLLDNSSDHRAGGYRWLAAMPALVMFIAVPLTANSQGRESLDFRADWRFIKGDVLGAEASEFDDSSWSGVRLPHDWAITGPFNPEENGFAGKLP